MRAVALALALGLTVAACGGDERAPVTRAEVPPDIVPPALETSELRLV